MKRVFVGIRISENTSKTILGWSKKYSGLPVRWIGEENLHITLVPPWQMPKNDTERIFQILDRAAEGINSFMLEFVRVTIGPDIKGPRLIWAEGKPSADLLGLKTASGNALGFGSEKRKFRPHITLARFAPEKFASLGIAELDDRISWREKVAGFDLFESVLEPAGARYTTLKKFDLSLPHERPILPG